MLALAATLAAAPPTFVVQTFTGTNAGSTAFVKCLERSARPKWLTLKSRGLLLSNRVYRKSGELNSQPGADWSVLVVSAAPSDQAAPALIQSTNYCHLSTQVEPVRSEVMGVTPGSYHPAPAGRARTKDLAFLIEFISVKSDPAALAEYRDTMRTSIGPAVGRLVRENQFYSMVGLETTKVLRSSKGAFSWNQLHIRGYYASVGITPAAMTRYMQEADPKRGDFRQVFSRLDVIRSKPRDDVAAELTSLAL